MTRITFLFFATFSIYARYLIATPPSVPHTALSDTLSGDPLRSLFSSSQYADLERFTRPAVGDKLLYNYHVPGSPITVYVIIDTTRPIERAVMGRTIFTEQKTLRKRLEDQGNAWLSVEDDPYEFDDSKTGMCMIGMKSIHLGGDDGARLTYKGVLDTLQALWDVLYFKYRTYEAAFQVENGTYLVANGKVAVGNVPSMVQLSSSKGNGVSQ